MTNKRIAILTGGGDAPGLNAAIRGIVVKADKLGYEVLGILDGWDGLLKCRHCGILSPDNVEDIHMLGGSILYTSRTNPYKIENGPQIVKENLKKLECDFLIAIGGEDTLGVASKLCKEGVQAVGVPKTIDNDLSETDYTFGFNTAITRAAEAIQNLHTTARSHHRIILVEVMGRHAGWMTLEAGMAGGASAVLLPEEEFDLDEIIKIINNREKKGKNYTIIAVSEGAKPKGGELKYKGEPASFPISTCSDSALQQNNVDKEQKTDSFGHKILTGIAEELAKVLEEKTGKECRHVVLGHLQRAGNPTAFDIVLATRMGIKAADMIDKKEFGKMAALKGTEIVSVPLEKAVGKLKTVPKERIEEAKLFYTEKPEKQNRDGKTAEGCQSTSVCSSFQSDEKQQAQRRNNGKPEQNLSFPISTLSCLQLAKQGLQTTCQSAEKLQAHDENNVDNEHEVDKMFKVKAEKDLTFTVSPCFHSAEKTYANEGNNVDEPIAGNIVFDALKNEGCIVLACNPRITIGVAKGLFRAAKDLDAPLIMELARTECNHKVGYTGLTPDTFYKNLMDANKEVGHDIWILHADHIGVQQGTSEEMQEVKDLISAQIKAGYTSFAIDASHLFNFEGKTIEEELEPNIKATIELANFIKQKMGEKKFGLEVEVGEIGRKDSEGMILTKPEEAVAFIKSLSKAGINPNVLAIANGSTHGNIYDKDGNPIAQTTIDINQTKAVAKALKENGFDVRIAQHGITGTPLEIIRDQFPHGDILKGNVATLFQNIVFDALEKYHHDLWQEMFDWTLKNKPIEGKKPQEIFGKNGKYAPKIFFDRIYAMSEACRQEIEEKTYEAACDHIKAFKSDGAASIIRKRLKIK